VEIGRTFSSLGKGSTKLKARLRDTPQLIEMPQNQIVVERTKSFIIAQRHMKDNFLELWQRIRKLVTMRNG
jgi:hypothetical protein